VVQQLQRVERLGAIEEQLNALAYEVESGNRWSLRGIWKRITRQKKK